MTVCYAPPPVVRRTSPPAAERRCAASSRRGGGGGSQGLPTVPEASPQAEAPTPEVEAAVGREYVGYEDFVEHAAQTMEAAVADIVLPTPGPTPVTGWFNVDRHGGSDTHIVDATAAEVHAALLSEIRADPSRESFRTLQSFADSLKSSAGPDTNFKIGFALRADSPGAPSTHAEAAARGEPWVPSAEGKELRNHANNASWTEIDESELPAGRRLHKLVWVYKEKRDGTAKARLCVQGCTLVEGDDYDQTFSGNLRSGSCRTLCAYAARHGCRIRSMDLVAAYLQGEFIEGEVVYCKMPAGYEKKGKILRIDKPIYGCPQSGRRLQRKLSPWFTDRMGMRKLEDSDGCIYVHDGPDNEIFAVGVYTDNCMIVHSAKLDGDGNAIDPNSYYAKFKAAFESEWDIVDEGEVDDVLAMQVVRNDSGSVTIHMEKYVEKVLAKWLPGGPLPRVQDNSLPYSRQFQARLDEALKQSTTSPDYPELVKPFQQCLGQLMYAACGARPDIAYPVFRLCSAMSRPTPDLFVELNTLLSYLHYHKSLGITYNTGPSALSGCSDANLSTTFGTSGWFVKWQGATINWGSKKQPCVALSSCEAEIISLSEATKDMVYFRRLVSDLDPGAVDGPSEVSTDNKGARDVAYNPEHHGRMKHVERRHFFVRDMVEKFEIRVPWIEGEGNVSDFLTKPLASSTRFFKLRDEIMNVRGQTAHVVCGARFA